jgi:uncharacterized protein (DUF433 family)/uncharacterized protein (DUF4415 family)
MSHPLYNVTDFEIIGDYTLRVVFDDDSVQVINFEPILFGEMYSPLKDLAFFNQVALDKEVHTLVWPNGADFDPWTLHEWPKLVDQLMSKVKEMSHHTDWDRLDKMTDLEIDASDIPPLDDKFFANAKVYIPPSKRKNFVQVDEGVLAWFISQSQEYQTLINEVLQKYVEGQRAPLNKVAEPIVEYQVARETGQEVAVPSPGLDRYIVVTPNIAGGKPRIAGRRLKVQNIVIAHEWMGWSVDQIAEEYELTLAEIYAALAYYYDHREVIDAHIKEDASIVSQMQKQHASKVIQKLHGRQD